MILKSLLLYFDGIKKIMDIFPYERFAVIANILLRAYEAEKKIFIMGNGGSASTATHFSCDINKGVSYGLDKRFKIICLNDNIPTMLAYGNDNSYEEIFLEQLKNFLEVGDVVIGISGSGNSKNVIKAIEYANTMSAVTIGMTGFDGGELAKLSHVSMVVPSRDMQKIEDFHMILTHALMQVLYKKLRD